MAGILFFCYFLILFYFLFFSEEMGRTFHEREYQYNLVPLKEISRFIRCRETLGMKAVLLNLGGNVAAFIPFGIFLPIFYVKCRSIFFTAWYSLELSLFVELIQLISKAGSFDVDDLLLNTLGGMIGYVLYAAAAWAGRRKHGNKRT